jgi:hypothetical protein
VWLPSLLNDFGDCRFSARRAWSTFAACRHTKRAIQTTSNPNNKQSKETVRQAKRQIEAVRLRR